MIRLAERPAVTLITADGTLLMVDRSDFPPSPSAVRFAVESTDITFNIILLVTLFAASSRAFSDRNMFGFAAAAIALVIVHVAAVVSFVEAWYAGGSGSSSGAQYGFIAKRFWEAGPYFYSLVGTYGSAIALWWLLRPLPDNTPKPAVQKRRTAGARAGRAAGKARG